MFRKKIFSSKIDFKRMEKVYDNSGVKTRFLTEDLNWYLNEHNWSERNTIFKENALFLLKRLFKIHLKRQILNPSK